MNSHTHESRRGAFGFLALFVLVLFAIIMLLTGCAGGISAYKAEEVHRTINFPLVFTDTVAAVGIKKVTAEDGSVKRKAETLTHTTQVGGFTRTVTYKGAELETKAEPSGPK